LAPLAERLTRCRILKIKRKSGKIGCEVLLVTYLTVTQEIAGSTPVATAKLNNMDSNLQGNIGESKVMTYYISENYSVYLPFGTASKNDMIVEKDGIIKRISVKSTRTKSKTGKYIVKIRQGKLNKQIPFDKNGSDILCVYIVPEDRIVFINSQDINTGFEISVI
jgi:hypothetical protein